ncbi:MAG: L-arabinose isomerase [Saprospiraceae bacterium]|nr:L-arabinose isomerase [Saprospiraceae bacterium]
MKNFEELEIWFVTGSQHLYGDDTLAEVAAHSRKIARSLHRSDEVPIKIKFKAVLTSSDMIYNLCLEVNSAKNCIGLITWMHTFSPAKMWINGLKILQKPLLHLHTQFNRDIPWATIDMNFMNLNQSAHGGREFGFISTRLGLRRKVVVGHWQEPDVVRQMAIWSRVAAGWHDMQTMKIARFGDNMREVAVTEGNKVSAQMQLGISVNGFGMGELTDRVKSVSKKAIDDLVNVYLEEYEVSKSLLRNKRKHSALRESARIELGIANFLKEGNFSAFTDTFENLTGLKQLPGLAVQRLMASGYGFGAEGDWKTAALVRCMKVMGAGLEGGNSFMEDYTYHFSPGNQQVLGAHMLEICPSITNSQPRCEIHPLGIGGKSDPVRLVFDASPGPALNASLIDLGHRFRLLVNTVEAVEPESDLPQLPVARVLWKPIPDLPTAAAGWIYAGGAHHTCFSQCLTSEFMEDFAEIAGIECIIIDQETKIHQLKNELRWNEATY